MYYMHVFQIFSLEDVERIMDETRDAVEYQQVSAVYMYRQTDRQTDRDSLIHVNHIKHDIKVMFDKSFPAQLYWCKLTCLSDLYA